MSKRKSLKIFKTQMLSVFPASLPGFENSGFKSSDFQVWQRIKVDGKSWDPERILWVHREGRLADQYAYGGHEISLYLDPGGSFMPRLFGTAYNSDTGRIGRLF